MVTTTLFAGLHMQSSFDPALAKKSYAIKKWLEEKKKNPNQPLEVEQGRRGVLFS